MPRNRVHRVRHRRKRRRRLRGGAAGPRLRAGRRAQVEVGDAMAARRHQHRRQHRERGLRPLLQHHARHRRVRHRPEGGGRRGHARPSPEAARPALPPGRRPRRAGDPGGTRPRRQPDLLHRSQERPGQGLGHRVRAHRRGRRQGRRRPHPRRPHLAIDALRGDADLAAVLHLAARSGEGARAGRPRSRRAGEEPGGAVGRRSAAHRPQRLPVAACALDPVPVGGLRLGRAAHRLRHR